jgi:hypothetical protein
MSAELNAIKTAYEEEGLTPDFIAEDRGLDLAAVKAALMQSSSKYRKDCGIEDEKSDSINFSKDEQERVKNVILDIALGADDDHLRFKAAAFIRDDAKGRRDVVRNMAGNNFNVLFLNQQLAKVGKIADGLKQAVLGNGHTDRKAIVDV